jgi:hypothetical protein
MSKPRLLTVTPTGDFWKGKVVPMLRITGKWVERAGIEPGCRVEIENPEPGVLVIRRLSSTPWRYDHDPQTD